MNSIDKIRNEALPLILLLGVRRVALFGSVARGEDHSGSDIDILVELKSREERSPIGLKWFALQEDLSQKFNRRVELISDSALSPYVRPYVQRDLVILYEEE